MLFSENYYLRKYFLNNEKVPTQSLMKEKMGASLADVYFNSMNWKLKPIAGFEPRLQGGGREWYMPPKDLLQGKPVLKTIKPEHLTELGWSGIDNRGHELYDMLHRAMKHEKENHLYQNTIFWKNKIEEAHDCHWKLCARDAKKYNFETLNSAFNEYTYIFRIALTKISDVLCDAAHKEMIKYHEETFEEMQNKYVAMIKKQAVGLNEKYDKHITAKYAKVKSLYTKRLRNISIECSRRLHDLNVDKHMTIEKCRKYLECQKLACQIYVALKEQECIEEMERSKHKHKQAVKLLTDEILIKDFEVIIAQKKENRTENLNTAWQKKICYTVQMFQQFVSYSLKALPAYAEFFINLEKLILCQLSEAFENSTVESIFVDDVEKFHTPIPRPHPFYLFCDRGYKPKLDQDLCPKHCTSSASQLPVIVVNKRCIYSACDNFEQFTDKIKNYIHGRLKEDVVCKDYHDYTRDVPVKTTSLLRLQELKLESSLLQVLQNEIVNVRDLTVECRKCNIPHCFGCSRSSSSQSSSTSRSPVLEKADDSRHDMKADEERDNNVTKVQKDLEHGREPKWESYLRFVEPKKCECNKMAKKHLLDNLPIYMRKMSVYEAPELIHYKMCPIQILKSLVQKNGDQATRPPSTEAAPKTKDMGTQYSDYEFDNLCNCFSETSFKVFLESLKKWHVSEAPHAANECRLVDGDLSPTYLKRGSKSFVADTAISVQKLMKQSPEIKEIYRK